LSWIKIAANSHHENAFTNGYITDYTFFSNIYRTNDLGRSKLTFLSISLGVSSTPFSLSKLKKDLEQNHSYVIVCFNQWNKSKQTAKQGKI